MASKFDKMARYLPALYAPTTNKNVRGLLSAWSQEDDLIVQAVQDAKEQIFVATAQNQYLDALGSNVGVFRPTAIGLADEQYRQLIPLLSFYPKQVLPTINGILEVFFGAGNYQAFESNPNEIVIQIPSSVPALRRTLRGSHHLHSYKGLIQAVDNIGKTLTVDLEDATKALLVDELALSELAVGNKTKLIMSNSAGTTGVTIQFDFSVDLSDISVSDEFNISGVLNSNQEDPYAGGFLPDKNKAYTVTGQRAVLNQNIVAGNLYPSIALVDSSGIPDGLGRLIFSFGLGNEEADVRYFSRPNNTSLLLDPSYTFLQNHSIGEMINVIVKPYQVPETDGSDYSAYLVGVEAARILAQQIVESVVAAGVVVRWIVIKPEC
jgi:hypothetical protein